MTSNARLRSGIIGDYKMNRILSLLLGIFNSQVCTLLAHFKAITSNSCIKEFGECQGVITNYRNTQTSSGFDCRFCRTSRIGCNNCIKNAVFMVLRIALLVAGTFMLTYTTSPIALTDGLESLLGPLKKLGAPVHELAMMMCIALRFIPTLIEETDKIMSAQKARGADFESGNLLSRAKALIPILVPLFISAFRRADELATAMECRCYHGGDGRTKLHELRYARRDWTAYVLGAIMLAGVVVLRQFGL